MQRQQLTHVKITGSNPSGRAQLTVFTAVDVVAPEIEAVVVGPIVGSVTVADPCEEVLPF